MGNKKYTQAHLEHQLADQLRSKRRQQGFDPDELPSYAWLNKNGYSGIHRAARREFGMSTHQLLISICGFRDPSEPSNYWPGHHSDMHRYLERHFESLESRRGLAESTITGRRSRLKTLIEYHIEVTGHANILRSARVDSVTGYKIIRSVFDKLHSRHVTGASKLNYATNLSHFFDWSVREGAASHNPAKKALKEFGWKHSSAGDPVPVSSEQMARLWQCCENLLEQALIVCYGGGGLRTAEPTKIDVEDSIFLEEDDPRFRLEDRKNGPGTVALMAGVDVLRAYIKELQEEEEWNGMLFPSDSSKSGSLTAETLRTRVKEISERADVYLENGELPTPKNLRQNWYTQYTEANARWLHMAEIAAEDQGSSSGRVVLSHYLTREAGRNHFRDVARLEFEAAFPAEYSLVDSEDDLQKTQHTLTEWTSDRAPS